MPEEQSQDYDVVLLIEQGLELVELLGTELFQVAVGERPQDAQCHVAGKHLGGEEDHDAEQQQRDESESDALGQEAGDGGLLARPTLARSHAFWPAWATSTWPIADTSTPATSSLVAVR